MKAMIDQEILISKTATNQIKWPKKYKKTTEK